MTVDLAALLATVIDATDDDHRAAMVNHLRDQRRHAIARRAADLALINLIDQTIHLHERSNQ